MKITLEIDTWKIDEFLSLKRMPQKPPKVLEGERISFEDYKKEIKRRKLELIK